MNVKNIIKYYVTYLTVTVITVVLLASCSAAPKAGETPQDKQTAAVSETVLPEEQPKPETPPEPDAIPEPATDLPEENSPASGFTLLESNGLKLLYPSEWSLVDTTEKRSYIKDAISLFEIKRPEEDGALRVVVEICKDIPDGGFEQRKEEASMFFERFAPENGAVIFEDVIINGTDFYRMNVPMGDNLQETILAAVKNDKRYDIYADFDTTNPDDVFLIEKIFNNIEIADEPKD